MERFYLSDLIRKSSIIEKKKFIQEKCRNKVVLDLGCIRHDASFSEDPEWLHKNIKNVAKKVIGIDFLAEEVKKLQQLGYDIFYGDVTQPLNLTEKFDVITAGDLIEHLSNFEGFFNNCKKFLKKEGVIIITTPNPFYIDEFLYVGLKNTYFNNPEHTCWIDPLTLYQLAKRFNFKIHALHFIRNRWKLQTFISESQDSYIDILSGKLIQKIPLKKFKRIINLIKIYATMILSKLIRPILSSRMKLLNYSDYIAVLKVSSNE